MKSGSLSRRITLLLVATSLLVFAGGSLVMDHLVDHELKRRFHQGLLTQAQALTATLELEPWHLEPDNAAWLSAGLLSDAALHYDIRCGGRELAHSQAPPPQTPPDWPEAAQRKPMLGEMVLADGRHMGWTMMAFRLPLGEGWGRTPAEREQRWREGKHTVSRDCRLLLMQDRSRLDSIMLGMDWIFALGPLLALGVALFAVPLIVRRGLRPLGLLGERMGDIGPNEPGHRLAPTGMRELDPLVARFNEVLARMDDGLARERQFAGGLAHETRTRLAELRTLCEVESRYPSGRPLPALLAELGAIGAELETTVNALLLLTRLQSGLEQPRLDKVDPVALLERLLQRHEAAARQRGVGLRLERPAAPVEWRSDPALLEVVLGNLLGNACSYAPAGDTVQARVEAAALVVENAAPDLDAADLAHFGQRFWRKQPPHSGHAGLGLALAAAAAQALRLELDYRLRDGRLQARLHRADTPHRNGNDSHSAS
jgi:signal transduction histidine kinase